METAKCSNRRTAIFLFVFSAFLFVFSITVFAVFPTIYDHELKKQLPLLQHNPLYPVWRDLPIPIYESLYFFNITNGKKFSNGEEKLKVVEVGPYVYEASWKKENIRWYPNGSVSYQERRVYQFAPHLSDGLEEEDIIYQLNAPMTMAANMFKDSSAVIKFSLGLYFAGYDEHIVTPKTVRQLVYEGYEDPIIKEGKWFMKGLPYKNGIFSWLYGKNDSYDGEYTVYTGEEDIEKLNVIERVDGLDRLAFWSGDTCNMMNGSSAEMGPPLLDDQTHYSFYQSILCRTLTFSYSEDVKHMGLLTKRFSVDDQTFANSSINPDNFCFDTNPRLRTGVQDISACQFGAPVVLSFPHFYLADPYYLTTVEGLNPNAIIHSSHIDVEPTTGATLDLQLQLQVNLEIEPIPDLPQFERVRSGVYPVFRVQFKASVNEPLAQLLKSKAFTPKHIFYSLIGLILFISVILFVIAMIIMYRSNKSIRFDDDPILECRTESAKQAYSYQKSEHFGSSDGRAQVKDQPSKPQYSGSQDSKPHIEDEVLLDCERKISPS